MRNRIINYLLFILVIPLMSLVVCSCERSYPSRTHNGEGWTSFHYNPARLGGSGPAPRGKDLQVKWCYQTDGFLISSPAVAAGKVFITSTDGHLYCLRQKTGESLWSSEIRTITSSPAVLDTLVFIGAYCINANSGKRMWTFPACGGVVSSPTIEDGKIFVGSTNYNFYCVSADSGKVIWFYTTDGAILSSPIVEDGRVFVGSNDHNIYCFNRDSGKLLWVYQTGGIVQSSPAVVKGRIYIASQDNYLYSLNSKTGKLIWRTSIGWIKSAPAVSEGGVFVCSVYGKIYSLNANTGKIIWTFNCGAGIEGSSSVVDGQIFVGANDGKLYRISAETGILIDKFLLGKDMRKHPAEIDEQLGGAIESSPAIVDSMIFVGCDNGKIYCLISGMQR